MQIHKWVRLCLTLLALGHAKVGFAAELPFKVLGVIASNHSSKSYAVVKEANKTMVVRVGFKIDTVYRLDAVTRKEVYVSANGQRYAVEVGENGGTTAIDNQPRNPGVASSNLTDIQFSGDTVQVSASLRDHLVKDDLNRVLMQAAALPQYQDGRLIGFAIWEIEPGSIYEKVGLKNGDIVTKLNGSALSDVAMTIKLLRSLKDEPNASMTLLRAGTEQTIKLVIQ